MEASDEIKRQCGEVFLTLTGNIVFHCTLCENKYKGYEDYAIHINEHYTTIKEELDDQDANDDEYDVETILPMAIDTIDDEKPILIDQDEFEPSMEAFFEVEQEITLVKGDEKSEEEEEEEEGEQEIKIEDDSEESVEKTVNVAYKKLTKKEIDEIGKRKAQKVVSRRKFDVKPETEKPFACTHCDYRTNIKCKLEEHLRRHFGDRPFKCTICEKGFYTQNEKTRHTARQHPECVEESKIPTQEKLEVKNLIKSSMIILGDNKFQCKECGLTCEGKSIIWSHIRRHSTYKPHGCTLCTKTFYTRNELDTHVRSHTGEKPYLCTECGNAYSTSSKLTIHLKRHKNIRDKECPVCQRRFFNINQLRNHMAVHSDERPFLCDVCNSTFKRQKALSNHMKLHLNQRNYECEICDASFNQQAGLLSHVRNKHTILKSRSTRNTENV